MKAFLSVAVAACLVFSTALGADSKCHWYGFPCSSNDECCQDPTSMWANICDDGVCNPDYGDRLQNLSTCHWYGFPCDSDGDCCQDESSSLASICLDGFCEADYGNRLQNLAGCHWYGFPCSKDADCC